MIREALFHRCPHTGACHFRTGDARCLATRGLVWSLVVSAALAAGLAASVAYLTLR